MKSNKKIIDDKLQGLLREWKVLGFSKELLIKKITKVYEKGEYYGVRNKKC